jgi:hypothetical protein
MEVCPLHQIPAGPIYIETLQGIQIGGETWFRIA